jgi:hypothetical protein
LDHVAQLLNFLSQAKSFWFTLNTSYCHGLHLVKWFCMNKYDYEALLVAANLAGYTRGQLVIIRSQWDNFLGGHHLFGLSSNILFKFNKIKINLDGKRQICYVILIGPKSIYANHPSPLKCFDQVDNDGEFITRPPRLTELCLHQQKFQQDTEKIIVHTQIELDMCKEETYLVTAPGSPAPLVTATVPSIAPSTQPSSTKISPEKHTKVNKYPQFSQILGEDLDTSDSGTNELIQTLLSEIIDILCPGVGEEVKVNNRSNCKWILFVRVPSTSSEKSFKKPNAGLDRAIAISCNASYISSHLCLFYRESVLLVLEKNSIPVCSPMSAAIYAAMISELRITHEQEKVLTRHLRYHISQRFCPSWRHVEILYDGHSEVNVSSLSWDYRLRRPKLLSGAKLISTWRWKIK